MTNYNFAIPNIYYDNDEVENQLKLLRLSQKELGEALQRGLSAKYSTDKNHPKTSGGNYFYSECICALRDILSKEGFEARSMQNVELTTTEDIALYLCRGCSQTGLINGHPESLRKKGNYTLQLMGLKKSNYPNQYEITQEEDHSILELFPSEDKKLSATLANSLGLDFWVLLYNFYKLDEYGRLGIRAELSRPVSYNDDYCINNFSTRLILTINPFDPLSINTSETQFTPEVELDILKTG